MPIPVPSTVMTGSYATFGGGTVCNAGYLFIANGPVDLVLHYGSGIGPTEEVGFMALSAGQYFFQGGTKFGITQVDLRAASGTVSSPNPQVVQGNFTEPALPSIVPVAGGVTLPQALSTINFQHNDVQVAAQQTLDFEDAGGNITFTVTNDAPGTRVKVFGTANVGRGSSIGSSFPGSPATGDTFWLSAGNTQRAFVWDGTHWRSEIVKVAMNTNDTPLAQTDVGAPTEVFPQNVNVFPITDEMNAGCTCEFRFVGRVQSAPTKNAHVRPGWYGLTDNAAASGPTFPGGSDAVTTLADGATIEYIENSWQAGPTSGAGIRPAVQMWRDSGGSGATITMFEAEMLLRFTK